MPFIPFPDVPSVPGVPAIFRQTTIPSVPGLARYGLVTLAKQTFEPPKWGLFRRNGDQVLVFDAYMGINFKHESTTPTITVKDGKKSVTDKVVQPFEATITLAHAGDEVSRATVLSKLEWIVHGLEPYDVATPEHTYFSATVTKYAYERGEKNGASLLLVALTLRQIWTAPPTETSAAKDASGAEKQSNGQTQTASMGTASQPGQPGTAPQEPIQ